MSNTKHTPGPWTIERSPIQSRGGSNTVFRIGPFQACIYDDWRQEQERGISTSELEANANLIAASPELLEALKLIANHTSEADASISMREIAEEAIEKAEKQ
jgi:hypothetical protein